MREYLSEEDFVLYNSMLKNNWTGMDVVDLIYTRMFGYTNRQDYYDEVTIAEHCTDIKVPTFALDALDDPICGGLLFAPTKLVQSRESKIMIASTEVGAHVAHMQGHLIPKPWYMIPIMEWFEYLEARNKFKKKED